MDAVLVGTVAVGGCHLKRNNLDKKNTLPTFPMVKDKLLFDVMNKLREIITKYVRAVEIQWLTWNAGSC